MKLGAFSISLAVKNLSTSKAFYEKLGFEVFGGDATQNYLIMKNGDAIIGLFEGMFTENILTFNPGWDQNTTILAQFDDVRKIEKLLRDAGVAIERPIDAAPEGPAHFVVRDPDGNTILVDQHI